ncbi:hypothetical protein GUJ93_ZPchr0003g17074 [Zizania palustris]|uniref:Uncharacterized protein n=1 Tax=Zizania palustris TaxID=103762 RepID=A0A8J5SBJ9_ZIZPA|nr:hypothetical protein GUJ93_ZPchr0003g17074 [Zizania palustris]
MKAMKSVASFKIDEGNTISIVVTLSGRVLGYWGVFPEIPYVVGGKKNSMNVCIITTAKTNIEALRLLTLLGMPFWEQIKSSVAIRKKRLKSHHFMSFRRMSC